MQFGEKVKYLRELRGMTQAELANKTGFRPSYISGIETGERDNPPKKTIESLAEALRVRSTFLIDDNAVTFEEFAEVTGASISEELATFLMNKDNLPYLLMAKKLGEEKIPPEIVEAAIKGIEYAMKKK